MTRRERELMRRIQDANFDAKNSAAGKWLSKMFPGGYTSETVKAFAVKFSELLNIYLSRDDKRRKETMIYWLDQNLRAIKNYLEQNQVYFNNFRVTMIPVVPDPPPQYIPQKVHQNPPQLLNPYMYQFNPFNPPKPPDPDMFDL